MTRLSSTSEGGQVTAFVVVVSFALIFLAGLVVDGGYILAARRRAGAEADAAARAGAQALGMDTFRRTGTFSLDPAAAERAAHAYIAETGHTGKVRVVGDTVEVRIEFTQPTMILGLGGLNEVAVSGTGRARLAHGLHEEEGS